MKTVAECRRPNVSIPAEDFKSPFEESPAWIETSGHLHLYKYYIFCIKKNLKSSTKSISIIIKY